MKVLILHQGKYPVAAYSNGTDDSGNPILPALQEMKQLGGRYTGSAKGIRSLLVRYAQKGKLRPHGLTLEQIHHANYDPDIFEFIKGDIRVFCFIDDDTVVLTNTGLKRGRKANTKDVNKAIKIRTQYYNDKESGNLEILN